VVNKTKQLGLGHVPSGGLTPNIFSFSVKVSVLRCGADREERFTFGLFSQLPPPVRSRPPRGSLDSTRLSCGISGQADIGSTLSSEPSERALH